MFTPYAYICTFIYTQLGHPIIAVNLSLFHPASYIRNLCHILKCPTLMILVFFSQIYISLVLSTYTEKYQKAFSLLNFSGFFWFDIYSRNILFLGPPIFTGWYNLSPLIVNYNTELNYIKWLTPQFTFLLFFRY